MKWHRHTTVLVLALSASYASAADKKAPTKKKGASPAQTAQPAAAPAAETSNAATATNTKPRTDEPVLVTSTKFDFESASIDGKMKAPLGFMLHGRTSTSQVNMIELRTNFRNELRDSKAAVMAIGAPP